MSQMLYEDKRLMVGVGVLASRRRVRTQVAPPRYHTSWTVYGYRDVSDREVASGQIEQYSRYVLPDGVVLQYTLVGEPVSGLSKAQARKRVVLEQSESRSRELGGS